MKQRKPLTDKQKEARKELIKKRVLQILHVVGYIAVVLWVLFGLLYACSSGKQQPKVENTTIVLKQPQRAWSGDKSYVENIITDTSDIASYDIYYNGYGTDIIRTPYRAYAPFAVIEIPNEVGKYQFRNDLIPSYQTQLDTIYRKYQYPYSIVSDYDIQIEIYALNQSTQELTKPYINGLYFEYIDISYSSGVITWSLYFSENGNRNNADLEDIVIFSNTYPYGRASSRLALDYLVELFSGKYYYARYGQLTTTIDYYQRFIYLYSDYSVHNLKTVFQTLDMSNVVKAYLSDNYFNNYIIETNGSMQQGVPILKGDFEYNGKLYQSLNLYYDVLPSNGSNNGVATYDYLINDFNGQSTQWHKESDNNFYYLASLSLANNYNNDFVNLYYLGYLWGDSVNFGENIAVEDSTFYIRAVSPLHGAYHTSIYGYVNSTNIALNDFRTLGYNLTYENDFIFRVANGSVYVSYGNSDSDNGISHYNGDLYDVMTIVNIGFVGLTGLFGYEILPRIAIGTLVALPFTFALLMFIIKLFKR